MLRRVIAGLGLAVVFASSAAAQTFQDSDWSLSARLSCGVPKQAVGAKPVAWGRIKGDRKLVFTLAPGQVGACGTDDQRRHRAPYWERIELATQPLPGARRVHLGFEVTFLQGFDNARETFFQIHNWARGCDAYPPLMLKFDRGLLQVMTLRGRSLNGGSRKGRHRPAQIPPVHIDALTGSPQRFDLWLDFSSPNTGQLRLSLNGQTLVSGAPISRASCAPLFAKFGIYRPGPAGSISQAAFDDIRMTTGQK
ncbi:MAG: heparin lyase I family protein [Pseudomonadota bacterium]